MKRLSTYLPLFVGLFISISLYAANAQRLEISQAVIPVLISVGIALFYMGIFALHPVTSKSMPIIASLFTVVTLIWYVITPWAGLVIVLGSIVFSIIAYRRKLNTGRLSYILAFYVIGAVVFTSIWGIATGLKATTIEITPIQDKGKQPNIYFIVPDRMPSIQAMRESGLDPSKLVQALRDRGFYVKENQLSLDTYPAKDPPKVHTTRTMRYFASVLNLGKEIDLNISYKECRDLINNPSIKDALHEQGYSFINVASWFAETSLINTDISYHYADITFMERIFTGELNEAFWERTILKGINFRILQPSGTMNKVERDRQLWQMVKVKELNQGYSQFIMAHLTLPHEPYVWTADGKPQTNKALTIMELYLEQVKFTADYIVQLADNLRRADPTAIIIFQSDEGMAFRKPVELNYSLTDIQWNGVFTAWYLPHNNSNLVEVMHTKILQYLLTK